LPATQDFFRRGALHDAVVYQELLFLPIKQLPEGAMCVNCFLGRVHDLSLLWHVSLRKVSGTVNMDALVNKIASLTDPVILDRNFFTFLEY
jgi:hypothetical protein